VQPVPVEQEAPGIEHHAQVVADPFVQVEPHRKAESRRKVDPGLLLYETGVPLHAAIIGGKKKAPRGAPFRCARA
jgi:hypothetical protein